MFPGKTTGAASALTASCAPSGTAPEIVYVWTPAKTGTATIQTCSATDTDFDTVLYVRLSCAAPPDFACNNDTVGCDVAGMAGKGSTITTSVLAGVPYFIIVDGNAGASGKYKLTVIPPP